MTILRIARATLCSLVLSCIHVSLPTEASAQVFVPLEHEGELNKDFTRGALNRYKSKAGKGKVKRNGRGQPKDKSADLAARNDFALGTAIALNDEHRSGNILSGDWLSKLVDSLGAKIAAIDAEKSGSSATPVRFYVTASSAVNAFATADRTVYVTTGLLARIESEAQLAFILCHELGHVDRKHNLKLFLKRNELNEEAVSRRGRRSLSEDPFAINRYSRENEQEADDYGVELFKALGYAASEAEGVFDILGDSYLTTGEHVLRASDLKVFDYEPSQDWILDSLVTPKLIEERIAEAEAAAEELVELREKAKSGKKRERLAAQRKLDKLAQEEGAEDDSDADNPSTHPALEERVAKVHSEIGTLEGSLFQVWTEDDLKRINRQARYEVVDYNLRDGDYPEAILNSIDLLNTEPQPDSAYLYHAITHALLGQSVYRQVYADYFDELVSDLEEAPKSRRIYYQNRVDDFEEWPGARYAYGALQRMYHLIAVSELDDLSGLVLAQAVRNEIVNTDSKSAVIYTDRALEMMHAIGPKTYEEWKGMNPEAYGAAGSANMQLDKRYKAGKKFADLDVYNEENNERLESYTKHNAALGSNGAVVAIPQFRASGAASPESLARNSKESKAQQKVIKTSMREVGLRGDVISDRLGKNDADDMKDIRLVREYLQQTVSLQSFRLVPHNHDRVLDMMDNRKADKLVYLIDGNFQLPGIVNSLASIFLLGPILPYNTIAMAGSKYTSGVMSVLVLDPEQREISLVTSESYSNLQHSVVQRANYYTLFHQIKQKPKK